MTRIFKKDANFNISEHLSHDEFRCNCQEPYCNITLVHPELGATFERLRKDLGTPIIVTSGYRCPYWNTITAGSSSTSYHITGAAIDCGIPVGVSFNEFIKAAKKAGFTFVYSNNSRGYIHCDLRSIEHGK